MHDFTPISNYLAGHYWGDPPFAPPYYQKPGKQKKYGPYYQWTRKRRGKTVTVNLTASQAKVYQRAIDNHRKMEKIMQEMRALSLQICENSTEGVKKRKPRI